ncbi:MAG: NADPH-dependent reductase [Bacteroidetes bacterium]|jgi:NAD(P)H-dependent FMN reductase|nr:NADPH-dependent reductase [Bacteroidota bacterium]
MSGITIISGTNRPGSNTIKIAKHCEELLNGMGIPTLFYSLEDVPENLAFSEMFGKRSPGFEQMIHTYVDSSNKFLFVVPEYNGSYPGILKTFLDSVHPNHWNFKKAGLIGVSDGRAGNLRGIEQLTLVFNYLKMTVFYNKLPISSIKKLLDENGKLSDEHTEKALEAYLKSFGEF